MPADLVGDQERREARNARAFSVLVRMRLVVSAKR